MAKKTRTELSTSAINTNLPDNTQELITPTTERAQLTDERESVINYKDDLGGTSNAGKFLTVATDGESLTMVDEPSGVPDWVTFVTAVNNLMKLTSGGNSGQIQFFDTDGTTLGAQISWVDSSSKLVIYNAQGQEEINLAGGQILLKTGGQTALTIDSGGAATFTPSGGSVVIGSSGHITSTQALDAATAGGRFIGSSNIGLLGDIRIEQTATAANGGGGYIRFMTSPSYNVAPTEKMRISSGGLATFQNGIKFGTGDTLDAYEEGTWTPTMNSSQGNLGTFTSDGTYTRIGRLVSLQITYTLTVTGTPTPSGGAILVQNIPFSKIGNEAFLSGFGQQPSAGQSLIAFNYASGNTTIGIYRGDGNFAGALNEVSVITVQYLTP